MSAWFDHEDFSPKEEIAHAVTHGIGALGSVAGLVVLVVLAASRGGALDVIAVSVFGTSMVLLYVASTLFHALTGRRSKFVFRLLDHGAIYLLIAGTCTPFTLITLGGTFGWSLFGVAWLLATLGVLYEVVWRRPWQRLSLVFYLAMGWIMVIAAPPLMSELPTPALGLLLGGGIAYTAGSVFYAWRGFPYHHAVWHLFVLVGSALHYVVVLVYVIPPA